MSIREYTVDDYFVTLNGAVYDAIQAAYIVLRILPASVCLPICMFCSLVCMCECTARNTVLRIRSQMYGNLHVLHFILYLTFTSSLYDGKICLFSYGSGEINKQTHSWNS